MQHTCGFVGLCQLLSSEWVGVWGSITVAVVGPVLAFLAAVKKEDRARKTIASEYAQMLAGLITSMDGTAESLLESLIEDGDSGHDVTKLRVNFLRRIQRQHQAIQAFSPFIGVGHVESVSAIFDVVIEAGEVIQHLDEYDRNQAKQTQQHPVSAMAVFLGRRGLSDPMSIRDRVELLREACAKAVRQLNSIR